MMHFIEPTFNRPDIIARDEETGAYLCKSRTQYALVIPEQNTRHWSRRRVTNDDDALAKANALLSWQAQAETEADAKREYEIALREGGYYACFPEKEVGA